MKTTDRIAKLQPRQKPEAKDIIEEVKNALIGAQSLEVFDKISRAHMTRRCIWEGQANDGMLHGIGAFPWDGAIDSKVPLAEEIVSEHVRIRMASVRSGNIQIGPQNEIEDSPKASLWNDVLSYYRKHGKVKRKLINNLRLFYTCVEEMGYGVMKIDWRDRKTLRPIEITREQVVSWMAQGLLASMMEAAGQPEGQPPPESQTAAAQQAVMAVEEMLMAEELSDQAHAMLMQFDPTMPLSEARKTRRALGKKGKATYYAPRGQGGLPVIKALVPWVSCLHGLDLGPDGETSWWAEVEWLSELDFRVRCEQEGCSDKWRDAVLAQPNKGLSELSQSNIPSWVLNGSGIGLSPESNFNNRAPMFQILTVYRQAVNEAGIPGCYETMIHPYVPDLLGKHECCEVDELPFVSEMREPAVLAVQSRGVPELSQTDQLALKKLKDATTASAELAAFPPYERAMGDGNRIAPGQELPARRNTGTAGTQSRFLDVPGVDLGALKSMEMTRQDTDRLFSRGTGVDPDMRRIYLEDLGSSAVLTYEEVMRLLWLHIQAYVTEVTASRIAGRPVSVKATAEDLEGTADITVEFSAMALNQKTALDLAEFGTKVASLDRSGRVDYGAYVETMTRAFDPTLAERVIMPGEEASAQVEKDEQAVIAAITSGQYVTGRVNSPEARWKVLEQWLANPSTTTMLQSSPMVYAALQEHIKGLQQEQVQRTTNVFIGQTGQEPEAPWEQAAKPEQMLKQAVEGTPVAA